MKALVLLLLLLATPARALAQGGWNKLPSAPIAPRHGATLHAVGRQVLVFGGAETNPAVEALSPEGAVLDLDTRTWRRLPDAPLGERIGAVVAPTKSGLVVTGGVDRWRKPATKALVLAVAGGSWRPTATLPGRPRLQPSVATDGDLVVLFGGQAADAGDGECVHLADGVQIDTARGRATAIPAGPLSGRSFAAVQLHAGKLLVAGGQRFSSDGRVTPCADAAVFDLASARWTALSAPPLRPQNHLALGGDGGQVFVVGNDSRRAFGFAWNRRTDECTEIPGLADLDLGMVSTRVFAGSGCTVLWNAGARTYVDLHQAHRLDGDGLATIALPTAVRARQAFAIAQHGDDVVIFGGNHEIGLQVVDGPPADARAPLPSGCEGDGLHFDLRTGTIAAVPGGPLQPRARALVAIAGDDLVVLWGEAPGKISARDLATDGAVYRLR